MHVLEVLGHASIDEGAILRLKGFVFVRICACVNECVCVCLMFHVFQGDVYWHVFVREHVSIYINKIKLN